MSKKSQQGVQIVGKTDDGMYVVAGLFALYDTTGLPLSMMFHSCLKRGWQPSWPHFYGEAQAHGWKHKTIISRLKEAIDELWGWEYSKVVIGRLESLETKA